MGFGRGLAGETLNWLARVEDFGRVDANQADANIRACQVDDDGVTVDHTDDRSAREAVGLGWLAGRR